MDIFRCDSCEQLVFFESVKCTRCGHTLAFLPDSNVVSALEPEAAAGGGRWQALSPRAPGRSYRSCRNSTEHEVCNWAVPADDSNEYCRSCRLNHMIPNLANGGARDAWHKMEIAKRRLLYTLFGLGLPVEMSFDFLADGAGAPVFTGHSEGLITINLAEADDPFREKMREHLGETYRTVLGHFRHESGHYYWERLVAGGSDIERCRALFGDERQNYDAARQRHYHDGPADGWWDRHVSAYATMHPWEDWAETWAHYLHMVDGLQTARAYGLSLRPAPADGGPEPSVSARRLDLHSFDELMTGWIPLTLALNGMNRSFGTRDPYPFVLAAPAIEKLRFVHDVVEAHARGSTAGLTSR